MILITGYSVVLRGAVIDRITELEAQLAAKTPPAPKVPTTLREALVLALAQAEQIEQFTAVVQEELGRVTIDEWRAPSWGSTRVPVQVRRPLH